MQAIESHGHDLHSYNLGWSVSQLVFKASPTNSVRRFLVLSKEISLRRLGDVLKKYIDLGKL